MKKTTTYKPPICMAEEFWRNSQFSVARFSGSIKYNGYEYVICDKYGRDIYECSALAEKQGRDKAIEPGEPADLVIADWLPLYRKVGRERFIEIIKQTNDLAVAKEMAAKKS